MAQSRNEMIQLSRIPTAEGAYELQRNDDGTVTWVAAGGNPPATGSDFLPITEARLVVQNTQEFTITRDPDTLLSTSRILMYGDEPITHTIHRNVNTNLVAYETWVGAPVDRIAEMAGQAADARFLEHDITRDDTTNLSSEEEWLFGSGVILEFSFDVTRGVFDEVIDRLGIASITDRGTFNILGTDYAIDSRGQITEV